MCSHEAVMRVRGMLEMKFFCFVKNMDFYMLQKKNNIVISVRPYAQNKLLQH